MVHIPPALATHIGYRHGIVTTEELLSAGVTRRQIRRLAEAGHLVRCHNGVYRLCSHPPSIDGRALAACLAHSGLVVAGRTAGRMWRFRGLGRAHSTDPVEALARTNGQIRLDGVRVRRTTHLPGIDLVRRRDGIVVTSPVRTALELAADLSDDGFESIVEQLVNDRMCTRHTIRRAARRWATRGRLGSARVQRVLQLDTPRDAPPVGSRDELRLLRALRARGVPAVPQFPLSLPDGRRIRLDVAVPELQWGVEVNHYEWHAARSGAHRDAGRVRGLHGLEWQIEPVTDDDLAEDFAGTVAELTQLHHERARWVTQRIHAR